MNEQYYQQFSGTARLVGNKLFKKFIDAHVVIVGVGGVGSWSAESLARSGIGTLTLIDLDDICITNTNRQLHALLETVGQVKIKALAERLLKINSNLSLHLVEDFLTEKNVASLIPSNSIVIDAIDSLAKPLSKRSITNFIYSGS